MRRAKRTYIRLAAFFAAQPPDINQIVMQLSEIEEVLGEPLPPQASFPFWWSNDPTKVHSRAWVSSGWRVTDMDARDKRVEFTRSTSQTGSATSATGNKRPAPNDRSDASDGSRSSS